MIRAVIFDLDGLLIDSEPFWEHSFWEIVNKRNGIASKKGFYKQTLGLNIRDSILFAKKKLGLRGDIEKLVKEWRKLFYDLLLKPGNLALMVGVKELVQRISKDKLVALATSGHKKELAEKILRKLGIAKYFMTVVSGDGLKHAKPDPEIFLITARELGIKPSSCLVLEDAPSGIQAAKSGGMIAYGVNKDETLRKEMKKAGADKVFHSLAEIEI